MRAFKLETNGLFDVAIEMLTRTDQYKAFDQGSLTRP